MLEVQTDENIKELPEILELDNDEKQQDENQKRSPPQNWDRNHKSAGGVRENNKNSGGDFGEKADRLEEVRGRTQAAAR